MLVREWIRTVRKTRSRFFSMFLIVALGVAFFSGIRSAEPDMRLSGDAFYDARQMADLRVIGTLGMTERDVERIGGLPGVECAEGDYFKDLIGVRGRSECNLRVMSLSDRMNLPRVAEGRLPEAPDECLLDEGMRILGEYQIGDEISFAPEDIEDVLGVGTFRVCGFAEHPYFISLARGSSTVGDGALDGLMLVPRESFVQDYYTDVLVQLSGSAEPLCYSDVYEQIRDDGEDALASVEDELCEARHQEIVDEATEKLDEAKEDLREGKEKLADAKAEADEELSKARQELKDAEEELADAKKKIEDGEAEIAKAKRTLSSNEKDLAKAKKDTEAGEKKIKEARKELDEKKETFEEQKKQVEEARSEVDAGKEAAAQAEAELDAAETELDTQETALAAQKTELETSLAALEAGKDYMSAEEYAAAKAQIDAGLAAVAAGEEQIAAARAEIAAGREELEQQMAVLEASEAEVEAAEEQVAEGQKQLDEAEEQVSSGELEIAEAKRKISSGETKIAKAKRTIAQNERDLKKAKQEVEDGEKELADGWQEYRDAEAEANEKIADAEAEIADAEVQIADAEDEIAKIDDAEWIVQDRTEFSPVYDEYDRDATNIGALGRVFPVIFFLVAMLVSLTTMTRMVKEERMQIGTLKALGFEPHETVGKYLAYGLSASLAGGIVGLLFGEKVLPYVIIKTYGILYTSIKDIRIPYQWGLGLLAMAVACGCILAATYAACRRELREVPAQLMRPEAPKSGRKIWLERFSFWKKVSFTRKSTVRNLLRYRKRLVMTLLGIAGCMGLVIVGFGLLDSISAVSSKQFVDLHMYDAVAAVDVRTSDRKQQAAEEALRGDEMVDGYLYTRQETMDLLGAKTISGTVFVAKEPGKLGEFIHIRERGADEDFVLDDESVVIAEKTADRLGVKPGESFRIRVSEDHEETLTVAGITENYYQNYVYMTPVLYERLTGEAPEYNSCLITLKEGDEAAFATRILAQDSIVQIRFADEIRDTIDDMLDSLGLVITVIITAAALLAFVVIYNLNNINIGERKRELATLKVLGFYDPEVAAYVYRENMILTVLGILLGLVFGKLLHAYVITTVEVELIMFGREIAVSSYLWSALLTFVFSMVVNGMMYFQLKKIDMVESLKSVE
ncbi:MAG: ABC transporter permease [Lachnospiraceae bacterium]|nr:ABC transporter permease [Lachnospiraceae bacterium]